MACSLPSLLPYGSLPSLSFTRDVGRERQKILHPGAREFFICLINYLTLCFLKTFIMIELRDVGEIFLPTFLNVKYEPITKMCLAVISVTQGRLLHGM